MIVLICNAFFAVSVYINIPSYFFRMDHDRGVGNSRYRYEEEEGRNPRTQKYTHARYTCTCHEICPAENIGIFFNLLRS